MTLEQAIDAIMRGETTEQYKKRMAKLKRLSIERDCLEDVINILGNDERVNEKRKRLEKVKRQMDLLK